MKVAAVRCRVRMEPDASQMFVSVKLVSPEHYAKTVSTIYLF